MEGCRCLDDGRGEHGDELDGTAGGSTANNNIYPSAKQKRLRDRIGLGANDSTGESVIVRDGLGEVGHGEAAFLEAEGGGGGSSFW